VLKLKDFQIKISFIQSSQCCHRLQFITPILAWRLWCLRT